MNHLFAQAAALLQSGVPVALVTVAQAEGSVPRGPGARMLVSESGQQAGTIGGGNVEYQAALLAAARLRAGDFAPHAARYALGPAPAAGAAGLGMVCGGSVTVLFHFLPAAAPAVHLCTLAASRLAGGTPCWLLAGLPGEGTAPAPDFGRLALADATGVLAGDLPLPDWVPYLAAARSPGIVTVQGRALYAEPLAQEGAVYVFGGGHVARALVPLLTGLQFRCTVLDDRPEFASPDLFPTADEVLTTDFTEADLDAKLTLRPADYVVVMTRGHQRDYEAQRYALRRRPYYLGVMGSRAKIAFVTQRLLADGFAQSEIDACQMPIGLAILAQTPEEIAVSVAGELIRRRALARGQTPRRSTVEA